MSVKTLESYQEFTADGSTTYFTFNFNYVDSSEIIVGMRTGDNQYTVVNPVNYVLTKNASTDGGKIRFVTTKPCENPDDPTCGDYIDNPPPAGTIVRIERKTVRSSTADWYVGLDMNSLVGLFDKLIRITQENTDKFKNTIQTFPTQQGITVRELLSEHDKKIFYWNNEKQWLDITDFTIDDIARQTDVGNILEQANAYSDEQNAVLESRINGKLTAVDAQIDANADAIQKTREDFINADSEIHQILNSHANELTTLRGNQASLGDQVSGIEEKIPGSASATNQLVTKEDLKSIDLEGYATTEYVNAREQEIRDDVNQADSELQSQITAQAAEIATKQDQLTAGDNIIISGNVISATGAGGGASLPDQTGNAGKFLTTDGTTASWRDTVGDLLYFNNKFGFQYTSSGIVFGSKMSSGYFQPRIHFAVTGYGSLSPEVNKLADLGASIRTWKRVYTTIINAGDGAGDLILPTEGGTLARVEDLEGIGGSSLPDQAGNEGKVLSTNGTDAEWTDMSGLIIRSL